MGKIKRDEILFSSTWQIFFARERRSTLFVFANAFDQLSARTTRNFLSFRRVEYRNTQLGIHADKINFRRRYTYIYIYIHMHISFFPSALRIIRREFVRLSRPNITRLNSPGKWDIRQYDFIRRVTRAASNWTIKPPLIIFQERSNYISASRPNQTASKRGNVATIRLFGDRLRETSFREEEKRTKFNSISSIRIRCFFRRKGGEGLEFWVFSFVSVLFLSFYVLLRVPSA